MFTGCSPPTQPGEEVACAVCVSCHVGPDSSSQAEFSLTWDMPAVHFGAAGHTYLRQVCQAENLCLRWQTASTSGSISACSRSMLNDETQPFIQVLTVHVPFAWLFRAIIDMVFAHTTSSARTTAMQLKIPVSVTE